LKKYSWQNPGDAISILISSSDTSQMKNEKTPLMLNLWASMENSLTCFTKDGFK